MHPYSDFYSRSVTIGMVIALIVIVISIVSDLPRISRNFLAIISSKRVGINSTNPVYSGESH